MPPRRRALVPRMLHCLACCLVAGLAATASPAGAEDSTDPVYEGKLKYRTGDYSGAYETWLAAARAGDPRAQYSVGVLFQLGQGVERDPLTAAKWFSLAAWQGYEPALSAFRTTARQLDVNDPGFQGWLAPRGSREAVFRNDPN